MAAVRGTTEGGTAPALLPLVPPVSPQSAGGPRIKALRGKLNTAAYANILNLLGKHTAEPSVGEKRRKRE